MSSSPHKQIVNQHCHGCIAVPILHCLRQVLPVIHANPLALEQLKAIFSCNSGHFAVALRTLQALGVLDQEGALYKCGPHFAAWQSVLVGRLHEFVEIDVCDALRGGEYAPRFTGLLNWWLESRQSYVQSEIIHFLDGCVITPLMIGLLKTGFLPNPATGELAAADSHTAPFCSCSQFSEFCICVPDIFGASSAGAGADLGSPVALLPQPPSPHRKKRWANTTAWWIFASGEKSIDAANCHDSSNI